MSKKTNIKPSVEEGKRSVELYNQLSVALRGMKREEKRQVLSGLEQYVKLLESGQKMDRAFYLKYALCATMVYSYLYRAGQLKVDKVGCDPEIRKYLNDIFITIANE